MFVARLFIIASFVLAFYHTPLRGDVSPASSLCFGIEALYTKESIQSSYPLVMPVLRLGHEMCSQSGFSTTRSKLTSTAEWVYTYWNEKYDDGGVAMQNRIANLSWALLVFATLINWISGIVIGQIGFLICVAVWRTPCSLAQLQSGFFLSTTATILYIAYKYWKSLPEKKSKSPTILPPKPAATTTTTTTVTAPGQATPPMSLKSSAQ